MRLAIMQPYLFPYIGYFQLIHSVERFVFYDDVAFIKQGWINRNRILLNGKEHLFSVQLKDLSSFRAINETEVNERFYETWKTKFYRTLEQAYKRAPYYDPVLDLVKKTFESENRYIGKIASTSVRIVCNYLKMETAFVESSAVYNNAELSGKERVLDICAKENATIYINVPGGTSLYSKEEFIERGLELKFIKPGKVAYPQFKNEFVPWLSIIDVLMFNSVEQVQTLLKEYTLE